MLRSHFEFAYLLCIVIFISSVSAVSFGDICSYNLSCHYPLICSNSSKCICPKSSFWNMKYNTCLSCPTESIEWKNEKCLLLIGSQQNGLIYEKASSSCLEQSTQLLSINSPQDLIEFEYKIKKQIEKENSNILINFLSNGFWINFTDDLMQSNSYNWCDNRHPNKVPLSSGCVRIMNKYSSHDNNVSLCLNRTSCYETLPYICEKQATIPTDSDETRAIGDIPLESSSMGNAVGNLVNVLVSSMQKPTLPPEAYRPQIHIVQIPVQAQRSSLFAQKNIILYVVLMIIVVVIIMLILLFCFGGFFFMRRNNNDSSAESETREKEAETEPQKVESKEVEIPIETKSEPSSQSQSRHILANFDTSDFE